MTTYLIIKWLHIISSVLLVGTGFGSAFYLFFANRSGSIAVQVAVARMVIRADWWITTPTVIVQPLTGIVMANLAGIPITSGWLAWTLVLYAIAGMCWLPVLWLQINMCRMAEAAQENQTALSAQYWKLARWWERLGYPAFAAMLVVFGLMVFKPQ